MNYVSSSSELGDQTKLSESKLYLKVILTREGSCPGTLQQKYENTVTKEGELDIVKSKDATAVALNNLLEVKPDAVK